MALRLLAISWVDDSWVGTHQSRVMTKNCWQKHRFLGVFFPSRSWDYAWSFFFTGSQTAEYGLRVSFPALFLPAHPVGVEFNRSADVLLIWFGEFGIWSLFLAWQNAHPCLAPLSCPQDSNRIAKLTSSRFLLLGDISEVSFFLGIMWRCVTGILMKPVCSRIHPPR